MFTPSSVLDRPSSTLASGIGVPHPTSTPASYTGEDGNVPGSVRLSFGTLAILKSTQGLDFFKLVGFSVLGSGEVGSSKS